MMIYVGVWSMSDYYGTDTVLSYLEHELDLGADLETILTADANLFIDQLFNPIEENLLSGIRAWENSDDGYGNNLSWRSYERGCCNLTDADDIYFGYIVNFLFKSGIKEMLFDSSYSYSNFISMLNTYVEDNPSEGIDCLTNLITSAQVVIKDKYSHLTIDLSRPVVFLDMDGVINGCLMSESWYFGTADLRKFGIDWVDMQKAKYLNAILSQHRCQVIVVSSWGTSYKPQGHEDLKRISEALPNIDIVGSGYTGGGQERGDYVLACVTHFNLQDYVIVDDAAPMYNHLPELHDRWISPHGRYGMCDRDFEKLNNLLTRFKAN